MRPEAAGANMLESSSSLFEEAVKAQPDHQAYHFHLGLTYQKLQDRARAKIEMEKAISLDPKSPVADQARKVLGEMTPS